MSFVSEFKEFAMKGNVVDMAVGVIIGGAFGKIVSSLVGDVVMPIVGLAVGGVDFSELYVNLGGGEYANLAAAVEAGAPVVKYGVFINTALDFLIIAFVIFMAIKGINKLKREEPPAPEAPKEDPEDIKLLREIRDSLQNKA